MQHGKHKFLATTLLLALVRAADVLEEEARRLADELGDRALPVRLDVTSEGDWQAAVAAAESRIARSPRRPTSTEMQMSSWLVSSEPLAPLLSASMPLPIQTAW